MPHIFFTFRPQINDQQLFEDFITLFIPFLHSHKAYAYVIENDGTLNKHIHAVLEGDYKDKDKFFQKWNKSNGLRDFKEGCKKFQNTDQHGFNTQKIPEGDTDLLHTLGYTLKEHSLGHRSEILFPDLLVTQAIEYYHAHRRIKSKETKTTDVTLITPKNAYAHIEGFIDRENISLPDMALTLKMTQQRYGFANISSKQLRLIQEEIHVMKSHESNLPLPKSACRYVVSHGLDYEINDDGDIIQQMEKMQDDLDEVLEHNKVLLEENAKLKKALSILKKK